MCQQKRNENAMQDDASKERNDASIDIIHPQMSRPSFHLARQMDGGQNNASSEVRYIPETQPLSAR
jgi:hypothetical protein